MPKYILLPNSKTGPQGLQGFQGITGSGTQGLSGINGTNGSNGTQGLTGINGTNGTQGSSGINGTNGTQGTAGINGGNGSQGLSGTNGNQGTMGASGSQGTSGTTGPQGNIATSTYAHVYFANGTQNVTAGSPFTYNQTGALSNITYANGGLTVPVAGVYQIDAYVYATTGGQASISFSASGGAYGTFTAPSNGSGLTRLIYTCAANEVITLYNAGSGTISLTSVVAGAGGPVANTTVVYLSVVKLK